MNLHKTIVLTRTISVLLSLAKLLHQLKPIHESSVTNGEVPENQINVENLSDNSVFKENAQHIHTNISTFKRKPESGDMLHFLKMSKLEAIFDALKRNVTCEIILANK